LFGHEPRKEASSHAAAAAAVAAVLCIRM